MTCVLFFCPPLLPSSCRRSRRPSTTSPLRWPSPPRQRVVPTVCSLPSASIVAPGAPWPICRGPPRPCRCTCEYARFFCDTPTCPRQTFTERLPQVAPHYARTMTRLHETQTQTGLALGGAAGARHLARQRMRGSRNTLLRRVRRLSAPEAPPPRVIGIDDWAKRKGRTYGTIVVDLERSCPIDVLEDRAAETVATWLQAHPEVTIVARDRAEAYASGVTRGAPDAVQVADRWHLLKNLREAIEAELHQRPTLPWRPPAPATAEALSLGAPADLASAD